ncbi:hypothetical protein [Paucilactobacillus sp. N302-9]
MANKNNIAKGQSDWQTNINNFMNEYFGNDSGKITAGITCLNGATPYKSQNEVDGSTYVTSGISMQTLSSVSGISAIIHGGVTVPVSLVNSTTGTVVEDSNTIPIVQFPKNVLTKLIGDQWSTPCSNGVARLRFNANDGTVSIYPYGFTWSGNAPTSGTIWLDVFHIFAI